MLSTKDPLGLVEEVELLSQRCPRPIASFSNCEYSPYVSFRPKQSSTNHKYELYPPPRGTLGQNTASINRLGQHLKPTLGIHTTSPCALVSTGSVRLAAAGIDLRI